MRGLDSEFIAALKQGVLHPLLERVRVDHTLDFQIRNNEVHIYYRGGKIVGLKKANGSYTQEFETKYFNNLDIELPTPSTTISTPDQTQQLVESLQQRKLGMDIYFSRHKAPERDFQQLLSRENNYSSVANDTDYFIADIEFALPGDKDSGRTDCLGIKWPSTSQDRSRPGSRLPQLALIEVKYGDSALGGSAGMADHMKKAALLFSDTAKMEKIKASAIQVFQQKRDLELIHFSKSGNKHAIEKLSDDVYEYLFVIANHKPASEKLQMTLEGTEFKDAHEELTQKGVNVCFATSCLMGAGLYSEYVLPLNDLKFLLITNE